jgi:hypothetical protein
MRLRVEVNILLIPEQRMVNLFCSPGFIKDNQAPDMHPKRQFARQSTSAEAPVSKRRFHPTWIPIPALIIAFVVSAFAFPQLVNKDVADYHTYDQLTTALQDLVRQYPQLARLESTGKTLEGRDIWMMELGNEAGTPTADRPALLIAANFEGNQVGTSELSLRMIRHLLEQYGSDNAVKKSLDENVYYVFPRVNPDGAEKMFASVQTGSATNAYAYDDDNDGRTDEDGPEDLNGDGVVTLMRVLDPNGIYMVDPLDERLMKKADPKKGETGTHSIYWEGTDNDSDGFYNEDAPGGVDINRNFQHEYPYYKRGAGPHMVSERESRAIMDFAISHRNIAMVLTLGPNDNLISAPNSKGELARAAGIDLFAFADASMADASTVGMVSIQTNNRFFRRFGGNGGSSNSGGGGRRPATTVNNADLEYFTTVSKQYVELTGIKNAPALSSPEGAFFQYSYFQYGVPSFSTPGWGLTAAAADADSSASEGPRSRGGSSDASFDKKLADWMDGANVDGLAAWTAYDHPTLGSVEIGGFKPFEAVNPPASVLDEMGPRNAAFAQYLTTLFPDVSIAETEVTDHGGGVFRIKAEVENAGFLPTSTAHGVTSRSVKPTMVQLGIDPDALLSGSAKTSFFQALDGSGNRESYEWLIKGKKGDTIELKVVSQKGGTDTASIRLQ